MTFDVSSIGFYVLDILGRPVDAIPPGGRALFIEEIALTVAGTGGGTAVACAILGLKTRAVGSVGEDEKGDFMLDSMKRHGIDLALMRRIAGVPTSATILPCISRWRPRTSRRRWTPGSSMSEAPGC